MFWVFICVCVLAVSRDGIKMANKLIVMCLRCINMGVRDAFVCYPPRVFKCVTLVLFIVMYFSVYASLSRRHRCRCCSVIRHSI